MVPSRVIRIDDEVWSELQRRAIPLEDNPNSVLRRILGLAGKEPSTNDLGRSDMDSRLVKLINMVGESDGRYLAVRSNRSGYFGMLTDEGKVFGYVYTQKERFKRLKVEIRKDWAEKVGIKDWEKDSPKDWFGSGHSVYWFIPDGEENTYYRVANHLKKMRKLIV